MIIFLCYCNSVFTVNLYDDNDDYYYLKKSLLILLPSTRSLFIGSVSSNEYF